MITVSKAKEFILQHTFQGELEQCLLDDCVGRVLAEDIHSPINMPLFESSAMDGYAFRSADASASLTVIEDIWAGKSPEKEIKSLQCTRIMTGAMLPLGADTVVMQEHVTRDKDTVTINQAVKMGDNVRHQGEEFAAGDLILSKGSRLSAGSIALAAAVGLDKLAVIAKPRVCIIVTGSELVAPGAVRAVHQIYESNSHALKAALTEMGITPIVYGPLRDEIELLTMTIRKALDEATHVIVCGGVSVGDHDHNKSVLSDLGVKEIFWKVAQKPGKPMYFGKRENTLVFGLPGNPASSLVCFCEYVRDSLQKFMGQSTTGLKTSTALLSHAINKKNDFTHFLTATAQVENNTLMVSPCKDQASHKLTGFSQANCLVVFDGEAQKKEAFESVTVHFLS